MKKVKIDIPFLISVVILVGGGFLIFTSASLGLLTGQEVKYSNVAFNQTFFGLFLGLLACVFTTQFEYKKLRQYSFFIFILILVESGVCPALDRQSVCGRWSGAFEEKLLLWPQCHGK